MSVKTVLDRLQVCNREVDAALKRAFREPPTKPIQPSDLPCVYMRPRGMTQRTPDTTQHTPHAGSYIVVRRYEGLVLVARATVASLDTSDEGAKLLADVEPWLDRFVDYYMTHPRLETNAGDRGFSLAQDISYQDTDPDVYVGSDEREYAGFKFSMDIAERRQSARLA